MTAKVEKVVPIQVRRARPTDCTNIYKLAKQAADNDPLPIGKVDETMGVKFVLGLITDGYVVVADISGRIVGVLATSIFRPPYSTDLVMDGEFLAIAPKFEERGVAAALMANVSKFASKNDVVLRLILCGPDESALQREFLTKLGMKPAGQVWVQGTARDKNEEQVDTEDGDSEVAGGGE